MDEREPDDDSYAWLYRHPGDQEGDGSNPADEPATERSAPPRRRALIPVLVGVLVATLVGGAGLVYYSATHRHPRVAPTAVSTANATEPAWTGPVEAVRPASVKASCSAPDATDSRGAKVTYSAGNAIDGKLETAWRCDGDGAGQYLEVTFDRPVEIAQLGIVNGYAKTDPGTNQPLYPQYRRITRVAVDLGGRAVELNLQDSPAWQQVRIPPVTTDHVRMRIEQATPPGDPEPTRDAVLVSEVGFARPQR